MTRTRLLAATICVTSSAPAVLTAQDQVTVASGAPMIARGTVVEVAITQQIGSKISKPGEMFTLRTADPILAADGSIILPAGLQGEGEIVHAAKAGGGGRAGELIVAARTLHCGDNRLPLARFHFSETGKDRSGTSGAVAAASAGAAVIAPLGALGGLASYLIRGGEIVIAPGTRGQARIAADIIATPALVAACHQSLREESKS